MKNATKKELARARATAKEGSLGTQKEHYGLRKIAARIKSTEIILIFFGSILHMLSTSQYEKHQVWLLLLNVPYVELNFTGMVAPNVTEKSALKPEPMI